MVQKIDYNIFLVNVSAELAVFGTYESICCYYNNLSVVIIIMCVIERCLLCGMITHKSVGSKY